MNAVKPHKSVDWALLDALHALAHKQEANWWKDVLRHDDLVIAVRSGYLNVYYRGASLYRIERRKGQIASFVHAKYLVRNEQAVATLRGDGTFADWEPPFWTRYESDRTLRDMMAAATVYAGAEKTALHPMLANDPGIIDVEIALPGGSSEEDSAKSTVDRLDAAVVHKDADGHPSIVFYEAKHFSNSELRAFGEPKVVQQLGRYRKTLQQHEQSLAAGYAQVARALVQIDDMKRLVRGDAHENRLVAGIREIASGTIPRIVIDPCLLVFGFDNAQKNGEWKGHLSKLEDPKMVGKGRIQAIGKPGRTSRFRYHAAN